MKLDLIARVVAEHGYEKLASAVEDGPPADWSDLREVARAFGAKVAAHREEARAIRAGLLSLMLVNADG